jgi:hypothetical protein
MIRPTSKFYVLCPLSSLGPLNLHSSSEFLSYKGDGFDKVFVVGLRKLCIVLFLLALSSGDQTAVMDEVLQNKVKNTTSTAITCQTQSPSPSHPSS